MAKATVARLLLEFLPEHAFIEIEGKVIESHQDAAFDAGSSTYLSQRGHRHCSCLVRRVTVYPSGNCRKGNRTGTDFICKLY